MSDDLQTLWAIGDLHGAPLCARHWVRRTGLVAGDLDGAPESWSWPDATALAALPGTAFSGEVHARRDNARLGWRRCQAVITRGDGAAEACLRLKEKTALVRELQLSGLSISIAEKTGALATTPLQAAPGGRPAFRIRVEATPPLDLGFCGAAPASNTASRRVDGAEGDDSSRFAMA